MCVPIDNRTEWLEADGLGGFASGTSSGERSRRYHALLLTATNPPTGRMVLVNGFDAWIETDFGKFAISSQRYQPNVVWPDGASRILDFRTEPWPTWTFQLPDGMRIVQELFVPHGISACCLRWRHRENVGPSDSITDRTSRGILKLRLFFSGRDYHATHHENSAFRFEIQKRGGWLAWRPYNGIPEILALTNGSYAQEPEWFRNFLYEFEKERGLDFSEDLASPGVLTFDIARQAVLLLVAGGHDAAISKLASPLYPDYAAMHAEPLDAASAFERSAQSELARRNRFASSQHRAADAYLVRRGAGQTIIAGYPWFTDWGRDTFISIRGICLAIDRLDDARQILLAWAGTVSEGMLPNRFPDAGDQPEFNSVDASLWFVVAVHDLLDAAIRRGRPMSTEDRCALEQAVLAIVEGYSGGTRYGIRMDSDGLLAAGQSGTQLTWMDAKVGDYVITPRVGKPVEVEALWLNALWIAGRINRKFNSIFERGRAEFDRRFWNESQNCLFDVVDVDHQSGMVDASFRPNQIFAVGGLPLALLHGQRAKTVVDAAEARLLTPLGLRTLAPGSPGYATQCVGPPEVRDAAYHQGTVWPWLIGPFVEAWLRVRSSSADAKQEARDRFLPTLEAHLNSSGLGHITECTDAEAPFTPRGCPFQAWSLGEFMRLKYELLRV